MSEVFIESYNAKLWTVSTGTGVPVLLCNGGPGCCDYLGPVAAMIDDIARVIRFEPRGCGRSSQQGPYDFETTIQDIESIRKFYRVEQWIVGGHSFGPDLALGYALTFPQHVIGLIGISGGVIHKDRGWSAEYEKYKDTERHPEMLYPVNMDVAAHGAAGTFKRQPDLLRRIADLNIPAIYIYGEKDIRPSWPVQQLANLLPNGKFVLIPNAPHTIWHSHAAELRHQLREFLLPFAK